MKNFENWETQDVEIVFEVRRTKNMPLLASWLESTFTFDDYTTKRIEALKEKIFDFVD